MIIFLDTIDKINTDMLQGFFKEWKKPRTQEEHFKILKRASYCIVAIDTDTNKVVGFITALSDDIQSAFIPLLEVLPKYQKKGIGKKLVEKMLEKLKKTPAIDLTCNENVQSFYEKCGMQKSVGMVVRNY